VECETRTSPGFRSDKDCGSFGINSVCAGLTIRAVPFRTSRLTVRPSRRADRGGRSRLVGACRAAGLTQPRGNRCRHSPPSSVTPRRRRQPRSAEGRP
jgi:hypothetical protein